MPAIWEVFLVYTVYNFSLPQPLSLQASVWREALHRLNYRNVMFLREFKYNEIDTCYVE